MSTVKNIDSTIKLAFTIIVCQLVVLASVFLTLSGTNYWYEVIILPTYKFSIYIFGGLWAMLNFLMAISVWLIWISGKHKSMKKYTIEIFITQLLLSFLWSILFFKFHSIVFSFLSICILIVLLVLCIVEFSKISKLAAWLLVPYLILVCLEAILNFKVLFKSDYCC